MKRRELLRGGAAAALTVPGAAGAAAFDRSPDASSSAVTAFRDLFADPVETRGPTVAQFRGRLPLTLRGTLYRNGPARMQRGALHYRHWFDGDGMAQSFEFDGGRLTHRAAMIRTAKYVEEERAGRFLRATFGTPVPDGAAVLRPDDVNVANISVLPVGDELLALWEAGSAYRLDPRDLSTLGRKVWSADTDGAPFSAHPRVDPDGTVWSFGYMTGSGKLLLYQVRRDGRLARTGLIDAPNADMVHDFTVTERHLVFLLMPLLADEGNPAPGRAFIDRLRWHADRPSVVLIVDKQSLQVVQRAELPAMAVFHLGNAWEEHGTVRLQFVRVADFDRSMSDIVAATTGQPTPGRDPSQVHDIRVDLASGRAGVERLSELHSEFPRLDPRHAGRRTGALFVASRSPTMQQGLFGFNGVARMNPGTGAQQVFSYGDSVIAEEHLFVPRAGGREGDGWLVGSALDWRARRTLVSVFDASRLVDGPVAQASLPYLLPPGLHGAWVAAAS
jgi:all-trans-8'-apo-beta-carotenal 15,15'-oxygenase